MTTLSRLLAIETSTDALSVALQLDAELRVVHRVMPRQHQQQLFAILDELSAGQSVRELGLAAVVFGRGPGSFTGLRIAASAAQGLGYSLGIPVVGVSSLETQVRTFLRRHSPVRPCRVLSTIDARIGQLYAGFYQVTDTAGMEMSVTAVGESSVGAADALMEPGAYQEADSQPRYIIGSGVTLLAEREDLGLSDPAWCDVLPEAQDMLAIAERRLRDGSTHDPRDALPDYVQKRIGWKTLAEQGKQA